MDPSHLYAALHGRRYLLGQQFETPERQHRVTRAVTRERLRRRAVRWFHGLRRPTPAPVAATAQQAGC